MMTERKGRLAEERAPYLGLVQYWRACVADVTLGKGRFRENELPPGNKDLLELSTDELMKGRVGTRKVERLFRDADKRAERAEVRFWPLLAARRTSHGVGRRDRMPECVAPIVSVGIVERDDGRIRPVRTVIARDVLEPLPDGAFSVGTVADLDTFLTASPFSSSGQDEFHEEVWKQFRDDCGRLLKDVAGGWPPKDGEYKRTGKGLIEVAGDSAATVRGTLELYDSIIATKPGAPLLESWAVTQRGAPIPVPGTGEGRGLRHAFAKRLGHSNNLFPLADKQRDVLACLANAEDGEIVAVNGPPGTGKTTMLLSAIAGEWVRAARAGGDPPVVAAASTNNQAVTNVIDAFGKDFAEGKDKFAGRWLPDIESFGLYLPSKARTDEASKRYQTEGFFEGIETEGYVRKAKAAYLAAAEIALPELKARDVGAVVEALRERIDLEARKLEAVDVALGKLDAGRAEVESVLGREPEEALAALEAKRDRVVRENEANRGLLDEWEAYLAGESILLSLFGFLPAVARRRRLKARLFLKTIGYSVREGVRLDVGRVEAEMGRRLNEGQRHLRAVHGELVRGREAMEGLKLARKEYGGAAGDVTGGADVEDVVELERLADRGIRFDLFLLATHYWEGRWLRAMEELLPDDAERKKRGKKTVVPRWRRRMMLTPCMVSTFATLPGKMTVTRYEDGTFHKDYLFNFIDLLIVDEAGQVQPEAAGGAFALARRALVIGDSQQIEPIALLPKPVDIGNLVDSGVLSKVCTEDDLERVEALGVCSTGGSAMQVAQSACRYHPEPELSRGLWLFEHRRCYDEIVEYCNALCYKGKLEPQRGAAVGKNGEVPGLGPLAYLHVDGFCVSAGGSRRNTVEAETIAAWLAAGREELEDRYRKRLEEIVGIVTPFGAQVREIGRACNEVDIKVGGRSGMTVGTVHALQGADRDVVIFSPVYSKHADGGFIDMSPSMLNVAVSRAKDAFLVFGDMDLFSTAARGSPRHLLGEFLFGVPENALEFGALPRDDLALGEQGVNMLKDAKEHDEFLRELLAGRNVGKISIVSPWIVVGTMEKTGILAALKEACQRGMEIDVYVDPELNGGSHGSEASNLEQARAVFAATGVVLKEVHRLHSKIVICGETLLSVGSFNWLSAQRTGKYARHETSVAYRGSHLSEEIEVITRSLRGRLIGGED